MKTQLTIVLLLITLSVTSQQVWTCPDTQKEARYEWFSQDKFLHCGISSGMYVAGYTFFDKCLPWDWAKNNAEFLSATTTLFFAIAVKELMWEDTPDVDDCVADLVGVGVGYFVCKLLDRIELREWNKGQIFVRPEPFGLGVAIRL